MSAGHIRPRGPGAWELKYDAGRDPETGQRFTKYVTVRGTKKDAQRELRKLLDAVDKGQHVDRSKITVAELARERIALWQVSASTREAYLTDAKMLDPIGAMAAQKLTTRDIERWHGELRDRGLSLATIRRAHRLLVRVMGDATRHGLVSRNVAQEQPPPRAKRSPKVEIINAEQTSELLQKLEGDWFHVPVVTAMYCGMRRGEMLALRWCDVDLNGATMTIVRALEETTKGVTVKSTKTDAGERTISLPDVVVDALRVHRKAQLEQCLLLGLGKPADDALVFPDRGGRRLPVAAFVLGPLGAHGGTDRLSGDHMACAEAHSCQHADHGRRADHDSVSPARPRKPEHHTQHLRAPVRRGRPRCGGSDQRGSRMRARVANGWQLGGKLD